MHLAMDVGLGKSISWYVIYGDAKGAQCRHAAKVTNDLLRACHEESLQQPACAAFFVGDFNADVHQLSVLVDMLNDGWVDVCRPKVEMIST